MKIVVTNNQDLTMAQKARLDNLGEVTYYESLPKSGEEWLKRVEGAEIICAGTAGFKDAYRDLKDVYVTVAFVSVAFIDDLEVLEQNKVILSNAPGANKHAVSEWIMCMAILLTRELHPAINRRETYRNNGGLPPITPGMAGNNVTVLGSGNIGKRVGGLAQAFAMNVRYFKRGDDLLESVKDADLVIDVLSSNTSTRGLLDRKFFNAMKQNSHFISVTRSEIVDENSLIEALDSGRLRGAALDCGGILVGDTEDPYYQKLLNHPKILVTPHISYNSEKTQETGNNIMIDNVEAYINGTPQNIVGKV